MTADDLRFRRHAPHRDLGREGFYGAARPDAVNTSGPSCQQGIK